jgi:hypothetical protein
MNTNVKNICEIIEDIKEKLTDFQYKTILDNLMVLNKKKEEVEEEEDDETDEELEELSEQISFLNIYIPTIDDDELKKVFVRRLDILRSLFSERC